MPENSTRYTSIALVKEIESPENPGGLDKRVALVPSDVGRLAKYGVKVYVENGAGEGVGFSDSEYIDNNAIMQNEEQIYKDKELIIKLKGPSLLSIKEMKKGCTLLCMAHFNSYPERALLLKERGINVIAMEEICESPKEESDIRILSRMGMKSALEPFLTNNLIDNLKVNFIGWSERLRGAINRCGNRNPRSIQIIQPTLSFSDLNVKGTGSLYCYDSNNFKDKHNILSPLKEAGTHLFDLTTFEFDQGSEAISNYKQSHTPSRFGLRRIQCLHETGQAGARYGIALLKSNKPLSDITEIKAIVLGYGNIAQGAIDELHQQGIKNIYVLGRAQTDHNCIQYWLNNVDLVINGAEQAKELRGKNFLISNQHISNLIPKNSVVIDLVGGSPTNRSPVEAVHSCSFLTKPYFVQDGVIISALWGWPMLGMMHETTLRYSRQIVDVLVKNECLIDGLKHLMPGVQRALVCSNF